MADKQQHACSAHESNPAPQANHNVAPTKAVTHDSMQQSGDGNAADMGAVQEGQRATAIPSTGDATAPPRPQVRAEEEDYFIEVRCDASGSSPCNI
jgi:hypothetical protein